VPRKAAGGGIARMGVAAVRANENEREENDDFGCVSHRRGDSGNLGHCTWGVVQNLGWRRKLGDNRGTN